MSAGRVSAGRAAENSCNCVGSAPRTSTPNDCIGCRVYAGVVRLRCAGSQKFSARGSYWFRMWRCFSTRFARDRRPIRMPQALSVLRLTNDMSPAPMRRPCAQRERNRHSHAHLTQRTRETLDVPRLMIIEVAVLGDGPMIRFGAVKLATGDRRKRVKAWCSPKASRHASQTLRVSASHRPRSTSPRKQRT